MDKDSTIYSKQDFAVNESTKCQYSPVCYSKFKATAKEGNSYRISIPPGKLSR